MTARFAWRSIVAIVGIAGYLAFLATVDVPMYLARWRAEVASGARPLSHLEGLRDASVRWVVTHDIAEWKDEIAWMSLYFSAAVWSSLALCVCYSAQWHALESPGTAAAPIRITLPVSTLSTNDQEAGASRTMVEPCSNHPISSPFR